MDVRRASLLQVAYAPSASFGCKRLCCLHLPAKDDQTLYYNHGCEFQKSGGNHLSQKKEPDVLRIGFQFTPLRLAILK